MVAEVKKDVYLKEDVSFEKLKELGFEYDVANNEYFRSQQYLTKDIVFKFIIEADTRLVYYLVFKTDIVNEEVTNELNHVVTPTVLISMCDLLEVR